jgi:sortase A
MNPSINPLFPDDPNTDPENRDGFTLQKKSGYIEPTASTNHAADVIRQKLAKIYADEPDAKQEANEVIVMPQRSKHQEFMYQLSTSGKSLAEIQTEWHNYYVGLSDEGKHEVWQEFYVNNEKQATGGHSLFTQPGSTSNTPEKTDKPAIIVSEHSVVTPAVERPRRLPKKPALRDLRSPQNIKKTIVDHVSAGGKLNNKHHLQSLLFGIGSGLIVVIIFLFGFFNEVIIAPFIQPNRTASATPIIVDPNDVETSSTPQIIIPKINVQIPVDYSQTTTSEKSIENGLDNGIVHYPTTERPGQNGNAAFFGHSSNNIFNKGKYKFAFVLLHELVPGDTFYITNDGKTYIYKVIKKYIVKPTDVYILDDIPGQTATASLITCDPPGTTINRLVVVGEQISPDPNANSAGTNSSATVNTTKETLPGNGPTLWTRMWRSIF